MINDQCSAPHDHLCWRFGPQWAIRQGNWKLAQGFDESANPTPGQPDQYRVTKPQLFDLDADAGERSDLSATHPDKVRSLTRLYEQWNAANKDPAWMPNPNPARSKNK